MKNYNGDFAELVHAEHATIITEVLFIQGAGVHQTDVIQGMMFKRAVEGELTKAEKCKIAVYSCPLDILQTETKVGDYTLYKLKTF